MNKFKNRCKIVYLGQDGEFNWFTITVDTIVLIGTVVGFWYLFVK